MKSRFPWGLIAFLLVATSLVYLAVQRYQKMEAVDEAKAERSKSVESFFERFDNLDPPYYWSLPTILDIMLEEYDICSNLRVGDTYIIDVASLDRTESGYDFKGIVAGGNKITVNTDRIHPDFITNSGGRNFVVCYPSFVGPKNFNGKCRIEFEGVGMFSDEDIINDPEETNKKLIAFSYAIWKTYGKGAETP